MRNPFTMLKSAVSRFFSPKKEVSARVAKPAQEAAPLVVVRKAEPAVTPAPYASGYIASQRARNQRRRERTSVRAFVHALNCARG